MEQYRTEYRVIGIEEMHVAGGDGQLTELVSYFDHAPVVSAKIFDSPVMLLGFGHEHIVVHRLYLKIIIPRGDAILLILGLAAADRSVQLPRFAGRAQKYSAAEHVEQAPGYAGTLVKILQMRIRYKLVKVLQAGKRGGQKNYMVALELFEIRRITVPV